MNLSWLDKNAIIDTIEIASQLILQIYIGNNFFVENKNDKSPLTIADKKSNEFICNSLKNIYPHIPIISEENLNEEYDKRKNYKFAWLIDPLDGTKEFISKNGEFTVNIGLIYDGMPVAGFVTIPVKGLTYYALKNEGAWMREVGGSWVSLEDIRESFDKKRKKIRVIASRSHLSEETKEFVDKLGEVDMINVGSSIKILWVAENRADIYPRISPCMEWDTCAAHAILLEVGGSIKKYPDLIDELTYNKESLLNPFFVCKID